MEHEKRVLMNQLWSSVDTAMGFVDLVYSEIIFGHHSSLLDGAEMIRSVTKEEVVQAANKWELDTIYFLTREGEEE